LHYGLGEGHFPHKSRTAQHLSAHVKINIADDSTGHVTRADTGQTNRVNIRVVRRVRSSRSRSLSVDIVRPSLMPPKKLCEVHYACAWLPPFPPARGADVTGDGD